MANSLRSFFSPTKTMHSPAPNIPGHVSPRPGGDWQGAQPQGDDRQPPAEQKHAPPKQPSCQSIFGCDHTSIFAKTDNIPKWRPAARVNIPEFKLVLIGDGGVGKTTFVKRHTTGEFEKKYVASIGVDIVPIVFDTSDGPIKFNIWDTAGQDKHGGMKACYYIKADCAIIMFDVTSRVTYTHVPFWHHDLNEVCGDIPVVLVGNKIDYKEEHKVKEKQITYHRKKGIPYIEISAKSQYNYEMPILNLARRMMKNNNLQFVEAAAPQPPPEFQYDWATKQKNEYERKAAAVIPLPEDDGEDLHASHQSLGMRRRLGS